MSELEEQAKKLMEKRVREVRDEYGMSRSKTYDLEMRGACGQNGPHPSFPVR